MKGDEKVSIPAKAQSKRQVVDFDFWAVFLALAALCFFVLTLLLDKAQVRGATINLFAVRGLRLCSLSAFVTAIVALFRFRYSRGLAIIALLFAVPLVWLSVVVPLFAALRR
jgi:hypothetical protein